MIDTIYIERAVIDHPRTTSILQRFPKATCVDIERYGEVFNRSSQNFRLQKRRPALILAAKHDRFVLDTPEGYGVGGRHNYYFSHMLNCLYDCRYCFLQGMYRSAHYLLFVNYEDYEHAIDETLSQVNGDACWFFSGYDCDSLALEPVTGFAERFLPFFAQRPNAWIELRTKSTQTRRLLAMEAFPNAVVAFSFTPDRISQALEQKVPSVEKRLQSMKELLTAGWTLGLRFDPLVYHDDYRDTYQQLFSHVFSVLDAKAIHSVTLGSFRMPKSFFKKIVQMYPEELLYAGPMDDHTDVVSYRKALNDEMADFCRQELAKFVPQSILYSCGTG